jgi:hypothetical protein
LKTPKAAVIVLIGVFLMVPAVTVALTWLSWIGRAICLDRSATSAEPIDPVPLRRRRKCPLQQSIDCEGAGSTVARETNPPVSGSECPLRQMELPLFFTRFTILAISSITTIVSGYYLPGGWAIPLFLLGASLTLIGLYESDPPGVIARMNHIRPPRKDTPPGNLPRLR